MHLKCLHCKYEWDYSGSSKFYVSCPRCMYKQFIGNRKKGALLTMEGLADLREKALNGDKLPEDWEQGVEDYIKMKEKTVNKWKTEYLDAESDLKEARSIKEILVAYGEDRKT